MARKHPKKLPVEVETAPAPDTAAVAELAYENWIKRGCPNGSPEVDWLEAERMLAEKPKVRAAGSN